MEDLMSVVDWSRWQFALTAMYHWLFVPLTLGLSVIVAIMESIYYRNRSEKWLAVTKFWMKLFGINFAIGVATGIILEFEFGTNWSNYSWFVGDIFGAPLAIEGLFAFFMESTFVAVMYFGWKKVSPGFHLASTWLTALGASISALWILVANAWMQYPVGMEFDPAQMRNVMDNFWDVVLSPVAIHKFFHTVLSGWTLAGVFVCGVSGWFLLKKRNIDFAIRSIKVGSAIGVVGILITMMTGHSSAVDVARYQPMKLAAMEGLYNGGCDQELVAVGILNPNMKPGDDTDPFIFDISIPYALSFLAHSDFHTFVPGINDLLAGHKLNADGDSVNTVSYAERIDRGKLAHEGLRLYDEGVASGDTALIATGERTIKENYDFFGYGYLDSPEEAIPPVGMTFYAFHIMVLLGGFLLVYLLFMLYASFRKTTWLNPRWIQWVMLLSIPLVWICSEAGWVTAEVGRQPWIIEGIMPTKAAISFISTDTVMVTFWMFAAVLTMFLAAEVSIMVKQIKKYKAND